MSDYICSCNHSVNDHGVVGCKKSFCQCAKPKDYLLIESNKYRAEYAEASATNAERERDEARSELERVKAERDEAIDSAEDYKRAVAFVTTERNDMRAVLDYWLTYARFLPSDYAQDSEYNRAVKSLTFGKMYGEMRP